MPIVHVNGFGTLPVTGDRVTLLAPTTGTSTFSRQPGRYGGYALRHSNSSTGTAESLAGGLTLPLAVVTADSCVSFAMNFRNAFAPVSGNGRYSVGFLFSAGATAITGAQFGCGTSNVYDIMAGSSAWTVYSTVATATGWHWWSVAYKPHATAGYLRLYRDGALIAEQQPDTLPTAALTTGRIFFGNSNGGAQVDLGDLIITNDANSIPDSVVTSIFPTGTTANAWIGSDGNSIDNHLLIDEAPTYDAADYVGSATVGAVDTYTLGDLPNTAGTVHAVQVGARSFKSDAGAKTLRTRINAQNGTAIDPGGAATVYQLATTSDGSAAWTTATINAATASIEVVT